ncbi:flagellar basal body rod protein FlgB [Pseudohoeflea suaedae]|uniref:Flagellar basal body rod protein FlgB n=1 Tax=Pseudohoeflea suaedae TaxID=877384 RepID=A0A4R5PMM7_9HYPH|nr:flagellar basal body rod protein FlgB [Pseudohoeflea suaedae]TDH38260.1 flagellar basal body rod protein FlgB [Pseudohoeflea suaedae]
MQPIQLFDLASKQAHWLTVRQTVVAGNIANANTPSYQARDVAAFDAVLQETGMRMAATRPGHMTEDPIRSSVSQSSQIQDGVEILPSGNTVSLPDEIAKTSEIKRQYEINAGLVKSFHRMMLMTVKS